MATPTYRILYQVEITESDGTIRLSARFSSEAEAQAEIEKRKKDWAGLDRGAAQSPGYWDRS
jgi:hypothetical protein